jgi:hypothetical protein
MYSCRKQVGVNADGSLVMTASPNSGGSQKLLSSKFATHLKPFFMLKAAISFPPWSLNGPTASFVKPELSPYLNN